MMLRSSDNTDQINEEYHDPSGLETPSRAQLPRMLSMTLAEFDERVAEAIRAQTQNLTTSSTANRQMSPLQTDLDEAPMQRKPRHRAKLRQKFQPVG